MNFKKCLTLLTALSITIPIGFTTIGCSDQQKDNNTKIMDAINNLKKMTLNLNQYTNVNFMEESIKNNIISNLPTDIKKIFDESKLNQNYIQIFDQNKNIVDDTTFKSTLKDGQFSFTCQYDTIKSNSLNLIVNIAAVSDSDMQNKLVSTINSNPINVELKTATLTDGSKAVVDFLNDKNKKLFNDILDTISDPSYFLAFSPTKLSIDTTLYKDNQGKTKIDDTWFSNPTAKKVTYIKILYAKTGDVSKTGVIIALNLKINKI